MAVYVLLCYIDWRCHFFQPCVGLKDPSLFSVHLQVPLCYILMSGKDKEDYKTVLEAVRQALPIRPKVKEAMVDFEMAIWKALEDSFQVS